jgi:hypothetical protein
MGQEPGEIRDQIDETRTQMGDTVEALAHKANVPGRIKESVADKRDRLRHQMSGAGSQISDATPDTGDIKDGARQAVGVAQENPLGLAIGGVALGFLVGMALPRTSIEDQRLGPIADDVKDTVKETGQEALEHGREVASDAAQAATEVAKESGQEHAEELGDSAREKVGQGSGGSDTPTV